MTDVSDVSDRAVPGTGTVSPGRAGRGRQAGQTGRAGRTGAWAAALVCGLLGFAGGWYRVGVPPLWGDEGVTKAMASRGVGQILATMPHDDVVHGAYYQVVHVVIGVAGSGFTELRFPSVVAMAVAAAVTALLASRLAALAGSPAPAVTGLAAGVLFSLFPGVIRYAQEARSYAIVTMLAAITTYLLVNAMTNGGGARRWTAYGLAAWLTALFNMFGLFLLAAHAVTLLSARVARRAGPDGAEPDARWVAGVPARWFAAAICAVIATLPVVVLAYGQRGALNWMAKPRIFHSAVTLAEFWAGPKRLTLLILGLAALGTVAGAIATAARRVKPEPITPVSIALPWLVVPPVAVLLISQADPVYSGRYMEYCTPALAILAAWGVTWIARGLGAAAGRLGRPGAVAAWAGWLPAAAVFALTVVLLLPAGARERSPGVRADNLQGDSRIVSAHARPGDIVFFIPMSYRPIEDEFPADWRGIRDIALGQTPVASGTLYGIDVSPAELLKRFTSVRRVWVYTSPQESTYVTSARATSVDRLEARLISRMKLVRQWPDGDKTLRLYETR